MTTHLGLLLRHHVKLLLAHPGFGLGGIKVVLLRLVGLLQPGVAPLPLLPQPPPQLLQLGKAPVDPLGAGGLVLEQAAAALQYVVDARLVALQFLLQRLKPQQEKVSSEPG